MTLSRRKLLGTAAAATALAQAGRGEQKAARPVAVSSANGLRAVELAVRRMQEGADPLDAAIAGVNLVEDDPTDMTVGYGGVPNEDGVVQLDACVMHGPTGRAGAVASLEGVKNPTKVARLVMETTDHVLLVGPGARHFATMNGFGTENLLTEKARKVWLFWKQNLSDKDKWLEPQPDRYPPEVKQFIEEFGWDELRKPPWTAAEISPAAPRPAASSSRCRAAWAIRRSSARAALPTTMSDPREARAAARRISWWAAAT